MPGLTLLLTAAIAAPAAPAIPAGVRNDLQCMAIYAVAASNDEDAEVKQVGTLGVVYFLGRIEGAMPALDVTTALRDEIVQLEASGTEAVGDRCAKEFEATGKRLNAMGDTITKSAAEQK